MVDDDDDDGASSNIVSLPALKSPLLELETDDIDDKNVVVRDDISGCVVVVVEDKELVPKGWENTRPDLKSLIG
jgi:hypothetical protein